MVSSIHHWPTNRAAVCGWVRRPLRDSNRGVIDIIIGSTLLVRQMTSRLIILIVLLAAPQLRAQFVYTNPSDVSGTVFVSLGLLPNETGTASTSSSGFSGDYFRINASLFTNFGTTRALASGANVARLSYGADISSASALPFSANLDFGGGVIGLQGPASSFFADGSPAYMGVSFQGNDGTHYGWIQATYNGSEVTILDFAFNSAAGNGIYAGQISAIPEPAASAALAGAFCGSLALFIKRRRLSGKHAEPQPAS